MDTKMHSTHVYMLMFMSRSSTLAHKLLRLVLMLTPASLVGTGLNAVHEEIFKLHIFIESR